MVAAVATAATAAAAATATETIVRIVNGGITSTATSKRRS